MLRNRPHDVGLVNYILDLQPALPAFEGTPFMGRALMELSWIIILILHSYYFHSLTLRWLLPTFSLPSFKSKIPEFS